MKSHVLRSVLFILILLFIVPSAGFARKKEKRGRYATEETYVVEPDPLATKAIEEGDVAQIAAIRTTSHAKINVRYKEGIDVSHYQGFIDWDQVAGGTNISYAYLKATEGSSFVDDTYARNLTEARRVGLSVGSYHFYRPNVDWKEQLRNLTENVTVSEQDLVPIIDIEHRGDVSEEQFLKDLTEFVHHVEKHYGKKPMLYSYQNFYNRHLCGQFSNYPWMIAKYQSERPILTDGNDYVMWQYTSKGSVPGIKGHVDRSKLMGSHSLHRVQL